MEGDEFYVTVRSTPCPPSHPKNQANDFTNVLNHSLSFTHGDWTVGLADLSYPRAEGLRLTEPLEWSIKGASFEFPPGLFSVTPPNRNEDHIVVARIDEDFQGSLKELCQEFTTRTAKAMGGRRDVAELTYPPGPHPPRGERPTLKVRGEDEFSVKVGPALSRLLGLAAEHSDTWVHEGDYPCATLRELEPELRHLYVYCDLVKPRIVDSSHEPLLRIVPVQATDRDHSHFVHKVFHTPYLQPLHHVAVKEIRIHIRGDDGRPVAFDKEGIVVATLVFRRRRP